MKKLILALGTLVLACVTPFSQTGETPDERDTGVSLVVPQIVAISDTELLFPAYKGIGKIDLATMKTSKIVSFEGETRLASGKGTGKSSLWDWCVFVILDRQNERVLLYYKNEDYWYYYKKKSVVKDVAGEWKSSSSATISADWIKGERKYSVFYYGGEWRDELLAFSFPPPGTPVVIDPDPGRYFYEFLYFRYRKVSPSVYMIIGLKEKGPRAGVYYYIGIYQEGLLSLHLIHVNPKMLEDVLLVLNTGLERFYAPGRDPWDPRASTGRSLLFTGSAEVHAYLEGYIVEQGMRQVEKKDFDLAPEYLVDMILLETGGAARKLVDSCYMIGLWHYTALCGDTLYYFRKAPDGRARLYSKSLK